MEKIEPALYLIPVTLGETEYQKVLPEYNKKILRGIKNFIVENRRSAIRFLKLADSSIDIDSLEFLELNEHSDLARISNYLDPLLKKKLPMGIISEAGCPAVADPGAAVVEMAQKKNLKVVPLSGPSSMIMAVMASGLNGQSFAFNGYLPVKPNERAAKIRQLENRAWNEKQTQLFIEAPYRNLKMLESILNSCRNETLVCVAAGLTTEQEFIKTLSVAEWKKSNEPPINKLPAIFLIYRSRKMSMILMGIKHCGKSTQGRIISKKLSVPFFDTDDVVFEMTGKTPRQIYTELGNEGFQEAEEKACSFLLEKINSSAEKNAVIATGGGICGNKKALDVLKKIGTFVFLKTPERIASFRVLREISVAQDGTLLNVPAFIAKKNPRSVADAKKIFHDFFIERECIYEQLADVVIDMSSSSKEANAAKIIESVSSKV